ncbi:endo-beta-glucanase [Vararia minispora EC-137]|uniref:Endo-beta-glucanase n=1 Tax=Vararia minispora EC-137 TaxID=1314806 RepID=A0ACB8Q4K0_9AGAM|nr:endo-beta-glucanase [Vararia minispora EC-137]
MLRTALLLVLAAHALCASYHVTDTFEGAGFLNGFAFQAIADPTHGLVDYVDQPTALRLGLANVSGSTITLSADATTKLTGGTGRRSFRIQSNKQWDSHVSVYNVQHMPNGCGTWPAIWENGDNWPNGGEIDIVEGVNGVGTNQVTLHTSAGCTMPSSRSMTGSTTNTNCDAAANSNAGCGVRVSDGRSFGATFNNGGGGFYALERTASFVKIWFWARGSGIPSDVLNGAGTVDTDNWGTPTAFFPSTPACNIGAKFGPARIIINLTFCGDWAGSAYGASGCPGTCSSYVSNNPGAFHDAYFEIEWVKVYQ